MAIAFVGSAAQNGATAGNDSVITTAGFDTSTATWLAVYMAWYMFATDPVLSDSQFNTWVPRTKYTLSPYHAGRWFYCASPVVGASHTFTLTGSQSCYPCIYALAFTGVGAYDTESNGNSSGNTVQPGSVTPAQSGSLVLLAGQIDNNTGATSSTDLGFNEVGDYPFASGFSFGGSASYLIHTSGAINPTITTTGTIFVNMATTAVFSPGAGGGGGGILKYPSLLTRQAVNRASTY